jgi:serine/threonine-protein kinase HipA
VGIDLKSLPPRIKRIRVGTPGGDSGTLTHKAIYQFNYGDAGEQIALAMPVRIDPYNRGAIHPIFEMNLPEGFIRRELSDRLQRYTRVDDMLFLAIQGNDGVGRLHYESKIIRTPSVADDLDEIINWDSSRSIFAELLERHLFNTTLSGMQPKVVIASEKTSLQRPDIIIKSAGDDYPKLALNEYVCMTIANAVGLPTPVFQLSKNQQLFVMNRFDIEDGIQLGMEDFAVLMGRASQDRYIGSYENAARVINLYGSSYDDMCRFFDYVALCCMLGNGDAHLKNFSLLYSHPADTPALSPIYDVVCTQVYELEAKHLALKMNDSRDFPDRQGLLRFAKTLGIKAAETRLQEMTEISLQTLATIDELEDFPELGGVLEKTISRANALDGSKARFIRRQKGAKKRKSDSLPIPGKKGT